MTIKYPQTFYLAAGYKIAEPQPLPDINLESPAIQVLLDFRIHPALTLLPETPFDEAQHCLANSHASVLLVVDRNNHLCGVVTAHCLADQVAMRHISAGRLRRDIQVRDVMTPRDLINAVDYSEIARSSVHKLVTLLKNEGVPYLLVADSSNRRIVGVVAAHELAKLLNLQLDIGQRPSFREIFEAVMH